MIRLSRLREMGLVDKDGRITEEGWKTFGPMMSPSMTRPIVSCGEPSYGELEDVMLEIALASLGVSSVNGEDAIAPQTNLGVGDCG